MPETLPPHYVQLVWEATHKSFWRRQSLHDFLRRCNIGEGLLSSWTQDETKRDFLNRLFPKLEGTESGIRAINRMADANVPPAKSEARRALRRDSFCTVGPPRIEFELAHETRGLDFVAEVRALIP